MRELKFRAWNPEEKVMIANVAVRSGCFTYATQTSGQDFWDVEYVTVPEYPIMQFTGLCDRDGKEIYEGDILENSGRVKYEHGAYWCENAEWLHDVLDEKIIGNVHENPEPPKD